MTDAEDLQRRLLEANAKLRRQEPLVMAGTVVFLAFKWGSAILAFGAAFAIYQSFANGLSVEVIVESVVVLVLSALVCWKLCRWEDQNSDV